MNCYAARTGECLHHDLPRAARVLALSLLGFLVPFICSQATAQPTDAQWSIGVQGGVNVWMNDLNQRKVGPGLELFARYRLGESFSLGLMTGYEELKTKQEPLLPGMSFDYLKLHAFPTSIVGWVNLSPGRALFPYLYAGGGAMMYMGMDGLGNPAPDSKTHVSVHVPVGVGVEGFVSPRVSIGMELGLRILSEDVETRKGDVLDSYAMLKGGARIYFGTTELGDDDKDGLSTREEGFWGTAANKADTDGDGLNDGEEVRLYGTNPSNKDTDGDGLTDGEEVSVHTTDPTKADTDSDGLSDGDEVSRYTTDPLKLDTDGDGLTDGEEQLEYETDPLASDSDSDGLSDGDEVKNQKTNPNKADTDADALSDTAEVNQYKTNPIVADTDGGGIDDGTEVKNGTDPLNPKDDRSAEELVLERGRTIVMSGVTFSSGSVELTRESQWILDRSFIALIVDPDLKVEIVGYTDNVGDPDENRRLSLRRAQAVRSYLINRGIVAGRLRAAGKGMADPIAPNDTPEGRAKNRRIEFHVLR